MLIDMHVHTIDSDGRTHGPEVIKSAEENGMGTVVFANHETNTSNRLGSWITDAKTIGVGIMGPAIELTTAFWQGDSSEPCLFDLIIYGGDQDESQFGSKVQSFTDYEFEYYHAHVIRLSEEHHFDPISKSEYDYYIDPDTGLSYPTTRVSRTQLGNLVAARSNLTVTQFKREVPKRVYVDTPLQSMDMIQVGTEIGGAVVLAHPGVTIEAKKLSDGDFYEILKDMLSKGLIGVEVHHPKHSSAMVSKLRRMVKELDLVATGGSDYHGREGEYVGKRYVNVNNVEAILLHLTEP